MLLIKTAFSGITKNVKLGLNLGSTFVVFMLREIFF